MTRTYVVVVVGVVLTLTRIIKSVVTGQAPVTLELRNTPGKKHKQTKVVHAHGTQLTQFMHPPETYKCEIGSQPTMCQAHNGAYVSLLAPGKTDYTGYHPRKTITNVLHVVPITTHTHDSRKSIGKKETKKRKEKKEKKSQESEKRKRKGKERKDKKRKQGKEKIKNVILADPRN